MPRNDVRCRDDGRHRCRDNTATDDQPAAETDPNFILTFYIPLATKNSNHTSRSKGLTFSLKGKRILEIS